MFSSIKKFFSTSNDRAIKKMMVSVNKINDLESELQDKPDSYFKELKNQLAKTYKEKNSLLMNVGISVNHALMDGYHVGQFAELFQKNLNLP